VRRVIAGWKERGLRRVADEAAAVMAERLTPPAADVVTFVPPDGDRRLTRGYHPAERLASALATHWQLPCEPLLARAGPSRRQRGLTLRERRRNVARAFRAIDDVPRTVLLVDDVYTSGATVSSAASALRAAGARCVDVATFARAIR
jgi:predicted amidophosphoribosyltransferase